jgi:hypothetical protein
MVQRDYLLRMIEQFTQAVARILGLSSEQKFTEARRELDGAYRALGLSRSMLDSLDESSLRILVGEPKLLAVAMLLAAETHILRAEHRDAEAVALETRIRLLGFDPTTIIETRP